MKQIFLVIFMLGLGISTAAASTLRVTCEDQAAGAEVTINDKYKGECPIDIQLSEGKHSLKAVKKINGKNKTFQEQVRMGDGVTKRIEVTFGASTGAPVTAIRVDQNAIAQQRYAVEMEEYNRSIQSCLPKYRVELQRLKDVVNDLHERGYAGCLEYRAGLGYTTPSEAKCGNPTWDGNSTRFITNDRYEKVEFDEYFSMKLTSAQDWCEKQFTAPRAP
jgi:hypothetical protein